MKLNAMYVFAVICFFYFDTVEAACVRVKGTRQCCTGFIWNEVVKDCIACPLGYVGLKCEIPCIYPLYGLECQSVCKCSQTLCDIATGCYKEIVTKETPSKHINTDVRVTSNNQEINSRKPFSTYTQHTQERSNSSYDIQTISPALKQNLSFSTEALVIIGCLGGIILLLILIVWRQSRKGVSFSVPGQRKYFTKYTNDSGRTLSEDCIAEINNVTLTIVHKKRECVIQLEPDNAYESVGVNLRQASKLTPASNVKDKAESAESLSSIDSGGYVLPNSTTKSVKESEQNAYTAVIENP